VLTVMSGGKVVSKINMIGNYTTPNFKLGASIGGSVEITDPSSQTNVTMWLRSMASVGRRTCQRGD